MITDVLCVTLYSIDGEVDRYKVTALKDGKLVEVTSEFELVAAETEDGRQGWAVFPRLAPVEEHEGPVNKDEDPPDVVLAEDSSEAAV